MKFDCCIPSANSCQHQKEETRYVDRENEADDTTNFNRRMYQGLYIRLCNGGREKRP